MRIDLLLKKDGYAILPIEIKRPTNVCTERQETQLFSYMRQLKLPVGMYIGECIRLYFESPNNDKPIQIIEANLDPHDKNGVTICDLLDYKNIGSEQLSLFCRSKYKEQEEYSILKNELEEFMANGEENIKRLILQTFCKEGHKSASIENLLNCYGITVENISSQKDDNSLVNVSYHEISATPVAKKNKVKDNTHYSIDGINFLGKGRFVLHIVQQYVKDHPRISFQELNRIFPAELAKPTTLQVIQHINKAKDYQILHKDSRERYFFDSPINLNDGSTIVVNSEWGEPHFSNSILTVIKRLYKVYSK